MGCLRMLGTCSSSSSCIDFDWKGPSSLRNGLRVLAQKCGPTCIPCTEQMCLEKDGVMQEDMGGKC